MSISDVFAAIPTWVIVFAALGIFGGILLNILPKKSGGQRYHYKRTIGLLTQRELKFYKELLTITSKNKLVICPKVRLADIIEPKKGQNWTAAFNKIQSKHLDFVLCDPATMKPLIVVELDDSTHDRENRKSRDQFVDTALMEAGIPILHTRSSRGLSEKLTQQIHAQKQPVTT